MHLLVEKDLSKLCGAVGAEGSVITAAQVKTAIEDAFAALGLTGFAAARARRDTMAALAEGDLAGAVQKAIIATEAALGDRCDAVLPPAYLEAFFRPSE